jgi:hypothetical protein
MAKIVSKRGQPPAPPAKPKSPIGNVVTGGVQIHIFDLGGNGMPLTAEEQEEIGRIFENIRKQLDIIISLQDWERLCQPHN